ncbi:glycine zipper 2TM domain-containing protein [Ottowia sp.]|uniref:glycine zipper 2TM domain-containing protein n=1 Tax=Ottowia sp. TaxID=1898956 RepID=UPI0039E62DB5
MAVLGAAATAAGAQSMVTARVLSAQPVVEQVPVQDCGPYGGRTSGAGAAVGAVTGGLIGSQLGKGSGHIAGAILGALGGALLGNTAEASQPYYGGCATRYGQRVTGYDVTYEVGGRQYQTRMAQAPGQWLQVPAPDAYYGQPGHDGAQSYPVQPAPVAAYPMPAYPAGGESSGVAVVTAPPAAYGGYAYPQPAYPPPDSDAYPPQAYPQDYPPPVYQQPYPQPVYVQPAPRYVAPVGVTLSIGGLVGRHTGVGVGIGF